MDEKHVVAGKKDGSIDILDVELAFVLKSYPLEIKSGVQCIAKHSSDPSIFAISTVMGLCFINISPLNQRVKPIKSALKGLDIRSPAPWPETKLADQDCNPVLAGLTLGCS